MLEFLRAIFTTWEFRPFVFGVSLVLGGLYLRGWLRLYRRESARDRSRRRLPVRGGPTPAWRELPRRSQRPGRPYLAEPWRAIAYFGGLTLFVLALASGLDAYSTLLFFVHMIQHELLLMIVPPLLWLGNPYPIILWGLPRRLRLLVGNLMARPSPFRHALRKLTNPGLVIFIHVAILWGWHDSTLYNLALERRWVHNLEHLCFFLVGMLFWWNAVGSAPRLRRSLSYAWRMLYVVAVIPFIVALGATLSFATSPLYPHYTVVPRLWGISVMDDQMYGGVIMWESIMNHIVAALILLAGHFRAEEQKAPLPHSRWEQADALLAPGLEDGSVVS